MRRGARSMNSTTKKSTVMEKLMQPKLVRPKSLGTVKIKNGGDTVTAKLPIHNRRGRRVVR